MLAGVMLLAVLSGCSSTLNKYSEWTVDDWRTCSEEIKYEISEDICDKSGIPYAAQGPVINTIGVCLGLGKTMKETYDFIKENADLVEHSTGPLEIISALSN